MREHGTRARYVFGPGPGDDRANGCRCELCKDANRAYALQRDRARRRPDETLAPAYVDNREVRDHLAWLNTVGVGLRAVADRTGVSRTTLQLIRAGTRIRCTPAVAERILAVPRSAARGGTLVAAGPTWRLVDDLVAHGHTKVSIARALGQHGQGLQLGRDRVTARNARAVADLHARLLAHVIRDRENAAAARARYRQKAAA